MGKVGFGGVKSLFRPTTKNFYPTHPKIHHTTVNKEKMVGGVNVIIWWMGKVFLVDGGVGQKNMII